MNHMHTTEAHIAMLLLSESHSCALLREESVKASVTHLAEASMLPEWSKIMESETLVREIMGNVGRYACCISQNNADSDDRLSIIDLYKKMEAKGLSLDGTRKMLLKRLRDAA